MCARIKSRYRKSLSETIKRKITKPTNQVPKKSICVLTISFFNIAKKPLMVFFSQNDSPPPPTTVLPYGG